MIKRSPLSDEERKANAAAWGKKYCPGYYRAHQEVAKLRAKNWRLAHMERVKAQHSVYKETHLEQARTYNRKHCAEWRALGYVPLNNSFDGCEGHHINHDEVIYIPKELHRSIYHNQHNGQGMDQINALALQWLEQSASAS